MPKSKESIKNKFTLVIPVFFVCLILGFLLFRGSAKIAESAGTFNIAGYAWSSNFGWISMNCANDNSCSDQPGGHDYGININPPGSGSDFNFNGYAWSPNAGWISFQADAIPTPDNNRFKTNCANNFCTQGNGCTACYNPNNGEIFGWARVVALGNEGWISLGPTSTVPGIVVDQTSASGTFSGFAWNGSTIPSEGMGWISFNCNNPDHTYQCGTSSYAVYLKGHHLPQVTSLNAPNWHFADACAAPGAQSGVAREAVLGWTAPSQIAFEVILNNSNSTSSPLLRKKISTTDTQFIASNSSSLLLNYDTPYYWWVRVWDDFGFVSPWRKFGASVDDKLTDNSVRNSSIGNPPFTFTTYRHEFPEAKFSWTPALPLAYQPVTSTMAASYYVYSSPTASTRLSCDLAHCSSSWSGVNDLSNTATTSSSTVMTFKYGLGAQINLQVQDIGQSADDNYSCVSSSPAFFVDLLPIWKEKQAQ